MMPSTRFSGHVVPETPKRGRATAPSLAWPMSGDLKEWRAPRPWRKQVSVRERLASGLADAQRPRVDSRPFSYPAMESTLMSPQGTAVATQGSRELTELLRNRLRGRVRDLCVSVQPEGVVLHGRAPTYHAKQMAQHVAMNLCGLAILANSIEVERGSLLQDR